MRTAMNRQTYWLLPLCGLLWLLLAAAPLSAKEDKADANRPKASTTIAPSVPADFPRFVVPGHEQEMALLRELFWLHYQPAGPLIPLWDEWMPMSTLWPARGDGRRLEAMRGRWAAALAGRRHQRRGLRPHAAARRPRPRRGLAVPALDAGRRHRLAFRAASACRATRRPRATPDGWKLTGASGGAPQRQGLADRTDGPRRRRPDARRSPSTPATAPWLRLNWWASGLERANCYVEWTTKEQPEFSRRAPRRTSPRRRRSGRPTPRFPWAATTARWTSQRIETRTMIPVYRLAGWKGTITGLRIGFDNPGPASVVIKSFHTACDTRHTINNPNFIRGCHDYFAWSRDLTFLRGQIARIRTAMRFIMREFDTRHRKCVYTTWPGHEGRSGVRYVDGKKVIVPGEGIGSNYWDLLPFGGEDALATIYYYDALLDLADLEEQIAAHPEWNVATGADAFDPADLRKHAQEVKDYGDEAVLEREDRPLRHGRSRRPTARLRLHVPQQRGRLLSTSPRPNRPSRSTPGSSGQRKVEGDTATGEDIYHWRFAPRATTRRNLDYYFWGWSNPESVPWGYQVQDGGAVLGFSYHDLMARLKTAGPDDAWQRLRQILDWFDEVAGGRRIPQVLSAIRRAAPCKAATWPAAWGSTRSSSSRSSFPR